MLPILKPGQDILVFNWAYIFSKPKVGDIVVIRVSGLEMVKRIQMSSCLGIFVTGDNKEHSTDSRSFGAIEWSQVRGKVLFVR